MNTNPQNQVFTDQGSSNYSLPELLKGLGTQHRFLLFKNAAAELQLAHHSGKLRFRLKKDTGEILYTAYVSKADKIIGQAESFILGGKNFQQHFVFSSFSKGLLFDFEVAAKAEQLKREEAERVVRRKRDEVEKAAKRRQRLLLVSKVLVSVITVLSIAGFAYVKTFSRVVFPQDLLRSEQNVWVIYSPEQIKDVLHDSSIIDPIRAARDHGLNLSNGLFSLEQRINQLVNSKSAERSRLLSFGNEQLIKEFPGETKALAEVPADEQPVIRRRQPAPALNTKNLSRALGISHSEALRLKWDLDTPAETVISRGVFHTRERETARSAAIEAILTRLEDERPLQVQADGLRIELTRNQETRAALQQQALDKIKNLGFVKPTSSWFQIKRKPCFLVFERDGWVFELAGNQFEVELALTVQDQQSFLDYLLQLYSPASPAPSTLNK